MDTQSNREEPLAIPNLKDLQDALETDSDSQKLLEVFKHAGTQVPENLAKITDLWLKEASEEENAA